MSNNDEPLMLRAKALEAVRTLLEWIGDDPDRPGLAGTPRRVLEAWRTDWGKGYAPSVRPENLLTLFDPVAAPLDLVHPDYSEMVSVNDIAFYSHCEHHMAPFFGVAHISYVPSSRGIVGLSKLSRIVDFYSRRLQVQERLTREIADFLKNNLSPHIGVMIKARHMCMCSRGVNQPYANTITTALTGNFFHKNAVRAEFLAACRSGGQVHS